MGKAKAWKSNKDQEVKKQQLHGIKDGSVKKNKKPKFKPTPTSKVALINSSKTQNKPSRKNLQKGFGNGKIQTNVSPKQASKNNSNQSKQGSPNKKHSLGKTQNDSIGTQMEHKYILHSKTKKHEPSDDSSIKSDTTDFESANSSDIMEDSFNDVQSDSDIAIPDILGQSLADDSDEDDIDFEEEEEKEDDDSNEEEDDDDSNEEEDDDDSDEEEDDDDSDEEEIVEHRGVKMFKGLKSKTKKSDNDEEDQEEDDDDGDENKSDEDIGFGNEDDDEDDEDDEDEEEENDNDGKQLQKNLGKADTSMEIGESDEIEDEDEDEDDDSMDEELGIEALLGKSIADDDDDEDFNEEDEDDEDDDISSEDEYDISTKDNEMNIIKKENAKKKAAEASNKKEEIKGLTALEHLSKKEVELTKKMIAIHNIPLKTEEELRKIFGKFGTIKSFHLKYDPKVEEDLSKITKNKAFILYETEKSALKAAEAMHGNWIGPNVLFVQNLYKYDQDIDRAKLIAIHNLDSTVDDYTLWSFFTEQCGSVKLVQVHDELTGLNKRSAVIYFETEDGAHFALKFNGHKFWGRPMKVEPYSGPIRDKERIFGTGTWGKECLMYLVNRNKKKALLNQNDNKPLKKFKHSSEKFVESNVEKNVKKQKKQHAENKEKQSTTTSSLLFQGQKVNLKNKKKNKLDKKKKRMAEKLLAKSAKV